MHCASGLAAVLKLVPPGNALAGVAAAAAVAAVAPALAAAERTAAARLPRAPAAAGAWRPSRPPLTLHAPVWPAAHSKNLKR